MTTVSQHIHRGIIKTMADFKNMQRFVALVEEHNTQDYKKDDATLGNLSDINYLIDKAIKKDNALRAFQNEHFGENNRQFKNPKVVEVFNQAKNQEFITLMTSKDNERVAGEIILVEEKGRELIRKPWVLHRFLAWLQFRNNLVVLAVALIAAGILSNLDHIDDILKWLRDLEG